VSVRQIRLFIPDPSLRLEPHSRTFELPEVETFAIAAVTSEILAELNSEWPGAFVPEDATVRAAYRVRSVAVVDIGGASFTEGWSTGSQAEILAVYSIVHSIVANFDGIESVQILVNGGEKTTFAGHLDLSKPLRPDRSLAASSPADR
jgi:hypothetical protein